MASATSVADIITRGSSDSIDGPAGWTAEAVMRLTCLRFTLCFTDIRQLLLSTSITLRRRVDTAQPTDTPNSTIQR
jgi:hypothetical protein